MKILALLPLVLARTLIFNEKQLTVSGGSQLTCSGGNAKYMYGSYPGKLTCTQQETGWDCEPKTSGFGKTDIRNVHVICEYENGKELDESCHATFELHFSDKYNEEVNFEKFITPLAYMSVALFVFVVLVVLANYVLSTFFGIENFGFPEEQEPLTPSTTPRFPQPREIQRSGPLVHMYRYFTRSSKNESVGLMQESYAVREKEERAGLNKRK
ncbi:hypothetical protein HK103_003047 [Boothiomyces macroporosus]|uniref:Store-operated calcium entry-associated regulatory factor n=1 Tax=Boothiomyces macroporosus TaxID=261099 RepID=A0AAD5Y2D4_9FUNG|nr:hypothetical protein HK103_003047 [Boothiomyces macroporosus]